MLSKTKVSIDIFYEKISCDKCSVKFIACIRYGALLWKSCSNSEWHTFQTTKVNYPKNSKSPSQIVRYACIILKHYLHFAAK